MKLTKHPGLKILTVMLILLIMKTSLTAINTMIIELEVIGMTESYGNTKNVPCTGYWNICAHILETNYFWACYYSY